MKRKGSNAAISAREKFDAFIAPNINRLHKMLYAYMGSFEAAQDVLQESLIKAYGHIDTLNETEKAYAWLYVIARNEAKRYFRKYPIEEEISQDFTDEADDRFCRAEQKQDISRLLMCLEQDERELIVLKDMMDYSYAEMAQMLNISVSNVGVRLSRARDKLRKVIGESGYMEGGNSFEVQ